MMAASMHSMLGLDRTEFPAAVTPNAAVEVLAEIALWYNRTWGLLWADDRYRFARREKKRITSWGSPTRVQQTEQLFYQSQCLHECVVEKSKRADKPTSSLEQCRLLGREVLMENYSHLGSSISRMFDLCNSLGDCLDRWDGFGAPPSFVLIAESKLLKCQLELASMIDAV